MSDRNAAFAEVETVIPVEPNERTQNSGEFTMSVSPQENHAAVLGSGKDGVQYPPRVMAMEIGSGEMNLAVDADTDGLENQLEVVWENLCEAAGRTS